VIAQCHFQARAYRDFRMKKLPTAAKRPAFT
jgi:hypothetical protein